MPYKKSTSKKEPNSNVYYVACYVDATIANAINKERKSTGMTQSAIVRQALSAKFNPSN